MKKKVALIFGVTGQDGYYLTKLLLSKNYIVHGVRRRSSILKNYRIDEIYLNHKPNVIRLNDKINLKIYSKSSLNLSEKKGKNSFVKLADAFF